jgi:hypothetical protein
MRLVIALPAFDEYFDRFAAGTRHEVGLTLDTLFLTHGGKPGKRPLAHLDSDGPAEIRFPVLPGSQPNLVHLLSSVHEVIPADVRAGQHTAERYDDQIGVKTPVAMVLGFRSLQMHPGLVPRSPGERIGVIGLLKIKHLSPPAPGYEARVKVTALRVLDLDPYSRTFGSHVDYSPEAGVFGDFDLSNVRFPALSAELEVESAID